MPSAPLDAKNDRGVSLPSASEVRTPDGAGDAGTAWACGPGVSKATSAR